MNNTKISLSNQGTINKNIVYLGQLTLYFSYETIVAYSHPSIGLICCENSWSTTTGKFLNEICPDKKKRLKADEFEKELNILLQSLNFGIEQGLKDWQDARQEMEEREPLKCTKEGCNELQTGDGEFCEKHYPKAEKLYKFNQLPKKIQDKVFQEASLLTAKEGEDLIEIQEKANGWIKEHDYPKSIHDWITYAQ